MTPLLIRSYTYSRSAPVKFSSSLLLFQRSTQLALPCFLSAILYNEVATTLDIGSIRLNGGSP